MPRSSFSPHHCKQLIPHDRRATYAFPYVHDATRVEVVRVSVCGNVLTLTRSETPRNFPNSACVDGRVTYDGVKDQICNFDCCAGDCPCEEVQPAGTALPAAHAGQAWRISDAPVRCPHQCTIPVFGNPDRAEIL